MKFKIPLVAGIFLRRLNRFVCEVEIDKVATLVHVPNTGRLKELLFEGNDVYVEPNFSGTRKTAYTLKLAKKGDEWLCVDAQLTNHLAMELLIEEKIPGFENYQKIRPEVVQGDSRYDFEITHRDGRITMMEVKCVTLEENGVGRFPDAPTTRGQKHLKGLIERVESGEKAAVAFICQGNQMFSFSPNAKTDIKFSKLLVEAEKKGVVLIAYRMCVKPEGIFVEEEIPVHLDC